MLCYLHQSEEVTMKLFNNNNIKKKPKQTKNKTKQNNYSILFILTSKGFSDPIKKKMLS